jgi:solute carrier family 25 S-adenosylmethionine transporter 26
MACFVRVPTEVIKQNMQIGNFKTFKEASRDVYRINGILGFYKGFNMTIFREIPFSCIQFPIYEYLKLKCKEYNGQTGNLDAAICGMFAGATAAALTTPLDVLKTRMMLHKGPKYTICEAFRDVRSQGIYAFFSGIVPRVFWISIGGSIFLGVYDGASRLLNKEL